MQEDNLIKEIKKGNKLAFRTLVENNKQVVYKVCFSFLHNHMDAEDIAQEVFIEAFKKIYKFKSNSKISTWLYKIAVNKSLNYIRDNKNKIKFWDEISYRIISQSNELTDNELITNENYKIILQEINKLPKKQRIALSLNKFDNKTAKEISEIMGVSINSVEVSVHRAKNTLKEKLSGYFNLK